MSILSMFALLGWAKDDEFTSAKKEVKALRVVSWNFASIGKSRTDYDRVINVLGDADIAALQEVEFSSTGDTGLMAIANIMSKRTGEKICKGWFKNQSGERGRHAFLWRDSRISFVEGGGELREHCPDAPVVIRVDYKKMDPQLPYAATFFQKSKKQFFVLGSVQWQSKPALRTREKEIGEVFKKMSEWPWPTILAGNFKLAANDKTFAEAGKRNFKFAVAPKASKTATTSNMWVKNLSIVQGEAINMVAQFPEMSAAEIDNNVSPYTPLMAEFSFSIQDADVLKSELVKKKARDKSAAAAMKVPEEPPPKVLKPLPIHDDLESEAAD